MTSIFAWLVAHHTAILAGFTTFMTSLFAFEQWLAKTKIFKSNSTFQLILNLFHGIKDFIDIAQIYYEVKRGTLKMTLTPITKPPTENKEEK